MILTIYFSLRAFTVFQNKMGTCMRVASRKTKKQKLVELYEKEY